MDSRDHAFSVLGHEMSVVLRLKKQTNMPAAGEACSPGKMMLAALGTRAPDLSIAGLAYFDAVGSSMPIEATVLRRWSPGSPSVVACQAKLTMIIIEYIELGKVSFNRLSSTFRMHVALHQS